MTSSDRKIDEAVLEALHSARTVLGMEVAFVSEFRDGRSIFRHVDSERTDPPVRPGLSAPLEETYCQRVVDGRMPELLPDAARDPEARKLPATAQLPIGAYLGVPIRFSDGSVYGTFCCYSSSPDDTLNDRDLRTMRLFADFAGKLLERQGEEGRSRRRLEERIRSVLQPRALLSVYQPIFDIVRHEIVGFEALTRFNAEPLRPPDQWFGEAARVGLQAQLELAAIESAVAAVGRLPSTHYLSFNVSPETILDGALAAVLDGQPLDRLMLEVTEHALVSDYGPIARELQPLQRQGLKLAVDDAGAGFASFRHILRLKPDVIKLDQSLVSGIDADEGCRALAAALIRFTEETGSQILAEGVETRAELETLRDLRVERAQGFLLGYPEPLERHGL